MRAHYIDANTGTIASCVHNPLMTAPRPEMAAAYRNLYPFPEFQATCRGCDDEVPDYLIDRDRHYHVPRKELYFGAQRGLLDYLLFSTWEYRWDYHRDLFRTDRRPPPQRHADAAAAKATASFRAPPSVLGGDALGGIKVLRSRARRLDFVVFQAPLPAAPPAAGALGGALGDAALAVGWSAWDETDLGLEGSTKQLLFGYRPVGDVLAASRTACSEEVRVATGVRGQSSWLGRTACTSLGYR
jgi:hypothetical protein